MEYNDTFLIITLAVLCVVALISYWLDNGESFGDDLYN